MQDKKPKNKQGRANGHWVLYYEGTNKIWYTANFINNERRGHFQHYFVKNVNEYYAR